MQHLDGPDGTRLGYRRTGRGEPLVCVPGGPLLPADYLDDLGGLSQLRELVLLDLPGSTPATASTDPASYRCDRVAELLEVLRLHLGLERMDVLGHSAGVNVVLRHAEHHVERISRLVLVTPSPRAVGIEVSDEVRSAVARSRAGEPWYEEAAAALRRVQTGDATEADWSTLTPFSHGRWDDQAAALDARMEADRNPQAAPAFGAEGAFDPAATRQVLASLDVPVVVLAGSVDVGAPVPAAAELAGLFPRGELVVQQGAGHFPWVDDPAAFRALLAPRLSPRRGTPGSAALAEVP